MSFLIKKLIPYFLCWLFFQHTLCATPPSQPTQPELSADNPLVFDQVQKKISATGNATFLYQDYALIADSINYGTESTIADASGNIVFTGNRLRIVGDHLSYTLNDQQLYANGLRYGRSPYFFYADHIHGNPTALYFDHTSIFLGEPDCFSLNLKSKKTTLTFSNQNFSDPDCICLENTVFRIGNVPFFYLPYLRFPVQESPIDIDIRPGYSSQLGPFIKTTTLFNQFPELKWGPLLDYYTKRGFLIGPAADYAFTIQDSCLKGDLRAGYIHDHGNRGVDNLNRPISKDRHFIEWKHKQTFPSNVYVTSLLRHWSDSDVVRDFRPNIFNNNVEPDNFVEAIHLGPYSYISLFTRYRINDFNTIKERLPEINFDLVPIPFLDTPLYHQANANIVYLRQKNTGINCPEEYSYRFDSYYGLHYPIALTHYLNFTPVLGGKLMHYFSTSAHTGNLTRLRGQIGFDAHLTAFGLWNYCNDFWEINCIRHTIKPTIQYRYIPQTHSGSERIPIIEGDYPTTNLKPIDLREFRNRDFVITLHTMRLGLENFFQTRGCNLIPRELAHLHFYQDIHFKKPCDGKRLGDFFTDFSLQPAYWFTFNLFSRNNFECGTLNELRTGLCLQDGKVWSLQFTSDNLICTTNQYTLSARWNVTARTAFIAYFRYDAKISKLVEQTYSIDARVGNLWCIQFYISNLRNTTRENGLKGGFRIALNY